MSDINLTALTVMLTLIYAEVKLRTDKQSLLDWIMIAIFMFNAFYLIY